MKRTLWIASGLGVPVLLMGLALGRAEQDTTDKNELALRDFRPKSMLRVEEHLVQRAKFPCVNVHTHPGRLKTQEQVDEMVRVMDQSNIALSVSLDGRWGERLSRHVRLLTEQHPGRFVVFANMDYVGDGDEDEPATWAVNRPGFGEGMAAKLDDAVRRGASGLKVFKRLGLYLRDQNGKLIAVDDPRFDLVWAKCGELGIPVLIHTADPVAFFHPIDETNERWEELSRHPEWSFYGKDFPMQRELLAQRNRVIARHPETKFICAHMAGAPEDLATLGEWLDRYPNRLVEIAARVAELGRQPYTARRFFLKYADRILFGTDGVPPVSELVPHWRFLETWDEYFPYEDNPFPPQGLWNIYGLGLPDDVLRKVYYENAVRLIPGVKVEA
jgi:predicted TIM-barrel fold metal-dependent hydrolase